MNNAAAAYRQHRTQTATPAQLVAMLYNAFVAAIEQALAALEAPEAPGGAYLERATKRGVVSEALNKAQAIVTELRCSLDVEAGGEMARNLEAIYLYQSRRLTEANLRQDPDAARECLALMLPIRDAWLQACLQAGEPTGARPAVSAFR